MSGNADIIHVICMLWKMAKIPTYPQKRCKNNQYAYAEDHVLYATRWTVTSSAAAIASYTPVFIMIPSRYFVYVHTNIHPAVNSSTTNLQRLVNLIISSQTGLAHNLSLIHI